MEAIVSITFTKTISVQDYSGDWETSDTAFVRVDLERFIKSNFHVEPSKVSPEDALIKLIHFIGCSLDTEGVIILPVNTELGPVTCLFCTNLIAHVKVEPAEES